MDDKQTYNAKSVYERLGISSSSLRKWCIRLEEQGYNFTRDIHNNRIFHLKDVQFLEQFKVLVQDNGLSQDHAIHVMLNPTDPNISTITGIENAVSVTEQREQNASITVIEEKINVIGQVFSGVTVELNQQSQEIAALREEINQLRLTIAAGQEQKEEPGWISRFLRKFK
jgi:DNA-binding transcriptional MerR regulator